MTPHMAVAVILGASAVGVLSGVIAYEVRDARNVIRNAPVPPRVAQPNVGQSNVRTIDRHIRVGGQR